MNKKNKRSTGKDYYFPPEIWIEHILPRLPVKTVLRFRSVCKQWGSAIDAPGFVSDHFRGSNNNRDKNQLFVIEKMGHGGKRGCRLTLRQNDTLRRDTLICCSHDTYQFQVGCNGLFLVQLPWYYVTNPMNPSIRKSLSFPPCPLHTSKANVKYLFGFKSSINDYVLYAFRLDVYKPTKVSVAVYTLSDNIWRVKEYTMSLPCWLFNQPYRDIMCGDEAVFHDGILHWFGSHPDADDLTFSKNSHLVSFDFDAEKFSYLELPDRRPRHGFRPDKVLFAFGGSLAILSVSSASRYFWLLKNKVWDLLFSGLASSPVPFYCIHNRGHVFTKVLRIRDGEITVVFGKEAYNIVSNEIKQLTKSLSSFLIVDTYLESMVLHKGCEGQIITSLELEQCRT